MTPLLLLLVACLAPPPEDLDGDGSPWQDDCDETDPSAHPGADEIWYDGIDQDCAGGDDFDADGDGAAGGADGEDCDDQDPAAHPGADEIWYDGIDQDCAGGDDFDADGDGAAGDGGEDCDDQDPEVYPGAQETWYDGVDQDCAGDDDFDADQDGFSRDDGGDCDDGDAGVNPDAEETWYDGVDQDCDGNDDDRDLDGHAGGPYGDDCEDGNPEIHPGAREGLDTPGVDDDCDGLTDEVPWGGGAVAEVLHAGLTASTSGWECLGSWVATRAADVVSPGDRAEDPFVPTPDGFPDLLVTAPGLGYGTSLRQAVFLVPGDGTLAGFTGGVDDLALMRLFHVDPGTFGWYAAFVEDLDGDGVDEILADMPEDGVGTGRAWIYPSSTWDSAGWDYAASEYGLDHDQAGITVVGDPGAGAGWASAPGDLDGDGRGEITVGAIYESRGTVEEAGAVYVYLQPEAAGVTGVQLGPDDADLVVEGADGGAWLGATRTVACDLTADGLPDLVIGAPFDEAGGGLVSVIENGSLVPGTVSVDGTDHLVRGAGSHASLGEVLVAGGDVDGDGYDDVGASTEDGLGRASLLVLSGSTLSAHASRVTTDVLVVLQEIDLAWSADAGWPTLSAAMDGDLNGDGLADVVVGAPAREVGTQDGWISIFYGRPDPPPFVETDDADGGLAGPSGGRLGYAGLATMDLVGDDLPELVAGAPTDAHGLDWGTLFVLDPTADW